MPALRLRPRKEYHAPDRASSRMPTIPLLSRCTDTSHAEPAAITTTTAKTTAASAAATATATDR